VGDATLLPVENPDLVQGVRKGTPVLLGDGEVSLEVTATEAEAFEAKVTRGGPVRNGAGITARGLELPGGLTEKDQTDLLFGRKLDVDYVAISYVSSAADVADAKEMLAAKGESTPVLAKIERRSAMENIQGIVDAADGILVARGDLGIALPPEEVPVAQKRLLHLCTREGVLSITATQMLESMVEKTRPTRAEASDVSNAILDGSHVVMLSGETAIGVNPPRAVGTMASIARETERAILTGEMEESWRQGASDGSQQDAVAHAAVALANELGVRAIVSFTSSGSTAMRVAKFRPRVPIIAATPNQATYHRLALVWGVHPFMVHDAGTLDDLAWVAEDAAKAVGVVEPGDLIALTAGEIGVPGTTNLVRVATVH
ncbi:MAG: pyruvate kinase, partial [Candidatus Thermoplasmatota archaeon]|nr:pyruvate kinase [Candidatus Thermoplasmatota archaeon]